MGEKKRRLGAGPMVSPAQRAWIAQGFAALQAGDVQRARGLYLQLLDAVPQDAGLIVELSELALHLGDGGNAERLLRLAVAMRPGEARLRCNLAIVLRHFGRLPEAIEELQRAVAIEPALHAAHASLASARMMWAAELARSAPDRAALASEQAAQGVDSLLMALRLCPQNPAYWMQYVDALKDFQVRHPLTGFARDVLSRAWDQAFIDPDSLVHVIVDLTASHPAALEIQRRLAPSGTFDGLGWSAIGPLVSAVLEEPLLQKAVADGVITDPFIERLLGFARTAMLGEVLAQAEPSLPGPAIAALAHWGFNTEYAGDESPHETHGVDALAERLRERRARGDVVAPHWYAVYGAFRPLHGLDEAEGITRVLAGTPFQSLATRQISEPQEEFALRASIPALTRDLGEVSRAVRTQYEQNPYPRFVRPVRLLQSGSVRETLASLFPLADLAGIAPGAPRILIAGCGTGKHPIATAQRFREARVLAVDLSLASLAYAKRKTRELDLVNIEYRQGDILDLGALDERFDVIECSGVLHHLEDPLAGWRVLRGLLRPGALMRIGLYSEIARRHIVHGREFIEAGGHEATPAGIRRGRAAILARQDDGLLQKLARSEDFYSMSGCRDMLFHVQEHRFTLAQIGPMLDGLELGFLGFELSDPSAALAYRSSFPDDPAQTRLDHWHRFELDHPDTFTRMYQFWVRCRRAAP